MTNEDLIRQTASQYGVPPNLAVAVATQESQMNQAARGTSGEVGIFQLMPGTAADLGVNPFDTQQNVQGGVQYLKQMYDRFGDWATAVLAYNAGPTAVASGKIPASSQSYLSKIWGMFNPDSQPIADGSVNIPEPSEASSLSPSLTLLIIAGIAGIGLLVALKE